MYGDIGSSNDGQHMSSYYESLLNLDFVYVLLCHLLCLLIYLPAY